MGFDRAVYRLRPANDVGSGCTADAPGGGIKICLSLDKVNAFREGQQKLWRKAAAELGVQLIEQVAGEDAQRQSSQIDTCIAQKVAGMSLFLGIIRLFSRTSNAPTPPIFRS